jgi:hypothetical protein
MPWFYMLAMGIRQWREYSSSSGIITKDAELPVYRPYILYDYLSFSGTLRLNVMEVLARRADGGYTPLHAVLSLGFLLCGWISFFMVSLSSA